MAKEVKAGSWLFRISNEQKELQRATVGSSSYSRVWAAPNGERILDLAAKGEDVEISTDRRTYVRAKSGIVSSK